MQAVISYSLPIAIGIIMFGIGLNLTLSDFKRVFIAPKAIIIGLTGQLVLLPVVAFTLAFLFDLPPTHQLGLVLIAACPGGTASNIITYMLKGRVALSVSMTAFNSFLILFTIPFLLHLAYVLFFKADARVELSLANIVIELSLTVILPVIFGVLINEKLHSRLDAFKKSLRYILPGILFLVFSLVLITEKNNGSLDLNTYLKLAVPLLILNIVVMFVGFYVSGWLGIAHTGKYTIAIEMGLQNTALAIFIATSILKDNELAVLAVIYGGFSFFSTFILAYVLKKRFE